MKIRWYKSKKKGHDNMENTEKRKKMKMEEYDLLTNDEKLVILNKYRGKTKDFQHDNEFSWTYATEHCDWIKQDGKYVAPPDGTLSEEDEKILIIHKMNLEPRKKINVLLTDKYAEQFEEEKILNGFSRSDIINYLLYKYFEGKE